MNRLSKIKASLKRVKDPTLLERLLMVEASYEKPLRDAAESFGCSHGTIDFWKKRFEKDGLRGLYTKPKSGRPPKITNVQEKKIKRKVRRHDIKHGWTTKHVKITIYEETGIKYCRRQVIRICQSWGLSKIRPRPRYAYSKKEDRVAFVKKTDETSHGKIPAG